MRISALLLAALLVTACSDTSAPEQCDFIVQLDDAPIALTIGDSTRVTAHITATGLCQTFTRRVEWSVSVPTVRLTTVNDTVIQVNALSAGNTTLRARSFARLSAQDSVRITTAP